MLYKDALQLAMHQALNSNPRAVVLGQGVTDFKGVFGSTLGLADAHGHERVIEMPLSEEAMTGVGIGLALSGHYPIMTHIRLDFALLCMNQIVNMAAKYRYMFGGSHEVPLLIRLVVGRSWGQGAQHSQSLQSFFSHIPGLTVIMPSDSQAVLDSYSFASTFWPNPVVSIEHRLLYELDFKMDSEPDATSSRSRPPWRSKVVRSGRDLTVVATSIMVLEARRAADFLEPYDISVEIVDLGSPSHIDEGTVLESVAATGRLVVADTSYSSYGVSAEIARLIAQSNPSLLKTRMLSVTPAFVPCPTAKNLEDAFYPNQRSLCLAILEALGRTQEGIIEAASEESFRDYYSHFRGPF